MKKHTPKTLYKISYNGLIEEFYFIGHPNNCPEYAIYCNKSGHYPERVYLPHIDKNYYTFSVSKKIITKKAIAFFNRTINTLKKNIQ